MESHAVYTVDRPLLILRHALLLFLLPTPAASQPPPVPENPTGGESPSMGAITVVIIAAIFLLGLFSLYLRHLAGDSAVTDRRFSAYARRPRRGLDPVIIESFPVFDYSAVKTLKIGKGALECAVCLNEFEDDETLRLIPRCDHVFHPECIDSWLASHTTCPVCRAELGPDPDKSTHENQRGEAQPPPQNDDVAVDAAAGQPVAAEGESMEQPPNTGCLPPLPPKLNRNRTRRSVSGRRRWFDRYVRSNSTGHVAVKQWENVDRFTLRLPEEIRKQIISGKLSRTVSCVVLPRDGSSRVGNRAGFGGPYGEGINRNSGRSDRLGFSLALPFFTRAPKAVADSGGKSSGVAAEPKLPPV